MSAQFKINSHDLEEYLSVLARYSEVPSDDDEKLRELVRSYAELKFRIVGGARCGMCRSHVRHVVPVIAIKSDGQEKHYPCLCTRCFEGEKGLSERMYLEMGESKIEIKLTKGEPNEKRATRVIQMPYRKTHA